MSRAVDGTAAERGLSLARKAGPPAIATVLIALAPVVVFGEATLTYISNDPLYALIWGSELTSGHLPVYDGALASTPHPLLTAVGAFSSLFGDAAPGVMRGFVLLALGALVVGVFRLGRQLFAWPVGLLAAAVFATRGPVVNYGPLWGYQDVIFAALVVWGAVLEARRPRRGVPVLVLLTLAGLLRPEAWVLAGVYWLWLAPPLDWGKRLRLAALVCAAPVLWALSDLLVTGNPVWSFQAISEKFKPKIATTPAAHHGGARVPWPFSTGEDILRGLGGFLGKPETVVAVAGFAAGMVWLRRRSRLPAAVALAVAATSLILGAFGVPALTRFMLPAGPMLVLFVAVAALGWSVLENRGPLRSRWRLAGFGALAIVAAAVPSHISYFGDIKDKLAERSQAQHDLRDLIRRPRAKVALSACRQIYAADSLPAATLTYWTDRQPRDILSTKNGMRAGRGLLVVPATLGVLKLAGTGMTWRQLQGVVPADYRLIARNRSWRLYTGCRAPR